MIDNVNVNVNYFLLKSMQILSEQSNAKSIVHIYLAANNFAYETRESQLRYQSTSMIKEKRAKKKKTASNQT